MAYCHYCGNFISPTGHFCERCGTPVGASAPVQQGVPGRGLAITSLIFGIISGVIGLEVFILTLVIPDTPDLVLLIFIPIYALFPTVALIFASSAQKKGYKRALSRIGLWLSIISLSLLAITAQFLLIRLLLT